MIRQSEKPTIDPELARALRDHIAQREVEIRAEIESRIPPAPAPPPVVEVAAPQVSLSQEAPDMQPIAVAIERSALASDAAVERLASALAEAVAEFREMARLVRDQVDRQVRTVDALVEAVLALAQREIPVPVVNVEVPPPKSRRVVVDHWDGTTTQARIE